MTDENAEHKTLNGYVIANWKDESLGMRKTKPDPVKQGPHEFSIPVAIEITVPQVELPELTATVEVPRPSVEAGLRTEDAKHADPEAWQEGANEVVDMIAKEVETITYSDIYQAVGRVISNAEGYPDPAEVENYVHERFTEIDTENDD